jgi:hypothetical protein
MTTKEITNHSRSLEDNHLWQLGRFVYRRLIGASFTSLVDGRLVSSSSARGEDGALFHSSRDVTTIALADQRVAPSPSPQPPPILSREPSPTSSRYRRFCWCTRWAAISALFGDARAPLGVPTEEDRGAHELGDRSRGGERKLGILAPSSR